MYFPLLVGLGCRSSWVFCGGNLRESYMLETLRSRILTFPANHKLREVTWPVPCRQVCGLMFTFVRLDHDLELIHQRYHPRILSHQDTQTGSMVGRPNLDYLTGFHNGDGIQQTRRKSRYLKEIRLHLTNWAKLNKGENANSFFLWRFTIVVDTAFSRLSTVYEIPWNLSTLLPMLLVCLFYCPAQTFKNKNVTKTLSFMSLIQSTMLKKWYIRDRSPCFRSSLNSK